MSDEEEEDENFGNFEIIDIYWLCFTEPLF